MCKCSLFRGISCQARTILISPCIQAFCYFCEEFRAPDIQLVFVFYKGDDVFFGLFVVNCGKVFVQQGDQSFARKST